MLVFHITSWGIPLAIVTTALAKDKLGNDKDFTTGGWCWIDISANDKLLWMLITGKAWEVAAYILIAILFFTIKYHIRSEVSVLCVCVRRGDSRLDSLGKVNHILDGVYQPMFYQGLHYLPRETL